MSEANPQSLVRFGSLIGFNPLAVRLARNQGSGHVVRDDVSVVESPASEAFRENRYRVADRLATFRRRKRHE